MCAVYSTIVVILEPFHFACVFCMYVCSVASGIKACTPWYKCVYFAVDVFVLSVTSVADACSWCCRGVMFVV